MDIKRRIFENVMIQGSIETALFARRIWRVLRLSRLTSRIQVAASHNHVRAIFTKVRPDISEEKIERYAVLPIDEPSKEIKVGFLLRLSAPCVAVGSYAVVDYGCAQPWTKGGQ